MREIETGGRRQWLPAAAATGVALVIAIVIATTPNRASTYSDPNTPSFEINSFQDALDAAILKCALARPDCIGQTATSGGSVQIGTDGTNFQMTIQVPGTPPIVADKIKGKAMKLFQDQMALANSLAPGSGPDPNAPIALTDHAEDPNNIFMTITSTLSFKVRTADGRKGVLTVSVSPSFAVRWNLLLK